MMPDREESNVGDPELGASAMEEGGEDEATEGGVSSGGGRGGVGDVRSWLEDDEGDD